MTQEQEIDLRPIIEAILKNWIILVIVPLSVVILVSLLVNRTPSYTAEAQVTIVRVITTVDYQSGIKRDTAPIDPSVLQTTLASIATSGVVVQDVIDKLGKDLPSDLRTTQVLVTLFTADADASSNLITMQVSAADSNLATKIANTWVESFVKQVNIVFGDGKSNLVISAVQQQYSDAQQKYKQSEQNLADFISHDESDTLGQRADEYQIMVNNIRLARTRIITNTAAADVLQVSELISTYASLRWSGQSAALREQSSNQIERLQVAYRNLRRLEQLHLDATGLREHLAQGGDGESTTLSLQLLKAQTFSMSSTLPVNMQIQVSAVGKPSVGDVDSVLTAIDSGLKTVRAQVTEDATALLKGNAFTPPDVDAFVRPENNTALQKQYLDLLSSNLLQQLVSSDTLTQTNATALISDNAVSLLQQRVQQLKAQGQSLRAQRFILEQDRDISKTTYVSLGRQISELSSAKAEDPIVQIASKAVGATKSARGSAIQRGIVVGVAVLLFLILIIVLRTFIPLWLRPRPINHSSINESRT